MATGNTTTISNLPPATTLTSSDILPAVSGMTTSRITVANLANVLVGNYVGNIGGFTGSDVSSNVVANVTYRGNALFANLVPVQIAPDVFPSLGSPTSPWGVIYTAQSVNVAGAAGGFSISSDSGKASFTDPATGNFSDLEANRIIGDSLEGNSANITTNATVANLTVTGLSQFNNTVNSNSNITTTANISANYFIGNGRFLTGIAAGYSNADVANYLLTYTGNIAAGNIAAGNIAAGNIAATANISANYFIGNGRFLTGIAAGYSDANVFDYLGSNSNVVITTTGNITGGNLTAHSTSGTANAVVRTMGTAVEIQSNLVVAGNVDIGNNHYYGNGAFLTGIAAGYSNANVADYLPTYTGNLSSGNLRVTGIGNITSLEAGNVKTDNLLYANGNPWSFGTSIYGNSNVADYLASNSNVTVTVGTSPITTQGNITGGYVFGNGYFLSGISGGAGYSNANVEAYLPTYTGNLVSLTGNITTTANISGDYLLGNIRFATGGYGNAEVSNYLASNSNIAITTTGTLQSNNIVTTGTGVSTIVSGSDINLNCNNGAGQVNVTGSLYANAGIFGNNVMAFQSTVSNANADTGTWITVVINGQKFDLIARANTA